MTARTGAVCENVLFASSLPASVISALQTVSFPWTLLCQLFLIIVQELEDNPRTAVYRGSLFLSKQVFFPSHPIIKEFVLQNSLKGTSGWVWNYSAPTPLKCTSLFKCMTFHIELAHTGGEWKLRSLKVQFSSELLFLVDLAVVILVKSWNDISGWKLRGHLVLELLSLNMLHKPLCWACFKCWFPCPLLKIPSPHVLGGD